MTHNVILSILFAFVAETHGQSKITSKHGLNPVHSYARLASTATGALNRKFSTDLVLGHLAGSHPTAALDSKFGRDQVVRHRSSSWQTAALNIYHTADMGTWYLAELNVYGEQLQACGAEEGEEYQCDFSDSSPSICAVPHSSPSTAQPMWEANVGQCFSIYDFGSDNFVSHHMTKFVSLLDQMASGSTELQLKCDALPIELLRSRSTVDKMDNCELEVSSRCERFHSSLSQICHICTLQAPDEIAKKTLTNHCEALTLQATQVLAEPTSDISSPAQAFALVVFLGSVFLGSALTFAVHRVRRGALTLLEDPLLAPYSRNS